MKKLTVAALSVVVVAVVIVSALATTQLYNFGTINPTNTPTFQPTPSPSPIAVAPKKPFYVGVTYCGNSIDEAQLLVDKVKNYTNLFVIQSGPLMNDLPALEQICDYAVDANLSIIVYFARNGDARNVYRSFLDIAPNRWGSHFLGIYFNDEQGGKLIDAGLALYDNATGGMVNAGPYGLQQSIPTDSNGANYNYDYRSSGEIRISSFQIFPDGLTVSNDTTYFTNGTIAFNVWNNFPLGTSVHRSLWYQPNGVVHDENGTIVTDGGDIAQFGTYEDALKLSPLQTHTDAAKLFVGGEQNILTWVRNNSNAQLFTSEYALDWFDYQAGYDVVLAQLGWGQNANQNIARVRGAATLQGKSWGTIVTWARTSAPYLMSGDQMFEEMSQSYRSGADYVVVFNYDQSYNFVSENGTTTGTALLQDEHFAAMEKFWNEVVVNPDETNNSAGSVAFVLPQNYGWGMRFAEDKIWGIWKADDTTRTIWSNLQAALAKYGSQLDIVYNDPAYPLQGKHITTIDATG